MADFRHKVTGVQMSVSEGKQLGPEWEPDEAPAPAPKRKPRKKTDPAPSASGADDTTTDD